MLKISLSAVIQCKTCSRNVVKRYVTSKEARKMFIDYFVTENNHIYVPSSSVLPPSDSSLLFTSAGMNQFRHLFLANPTDLPGTENLRRVANSQKCIRVGGKHNDFDDVGKDCYHHTFFEMLGNWSFGDYFKKEACEMAWKLLTGPFKISPERLFVTYFAGNSDLGLQPDLECREIWREIGVSPERILPFGLKDNFWDMGYTGPCGPCTEIHYSHLPVNEFTSKLVNSGNPKVIELWNLVFIQYHRKSDGSLEKLLQRYVDTGMGLERLTAVLGNSSSNYDTDIFLTLFSSIQKISGCPAYGGKFGDEDANGIDTAYRIIADHARMATVCVADGVIPDEIGPGHCLRRAIRRGTIASILSLKSNSVLPSKLAPVVASQLEEIYPEISVKLNKIVDILTEEENKFLHILSSGTKLYKKMCDDIHNNIFPAEKMWELFFVHGIPEDLILDFTASRGFVPEIDKFQQLLADERLKSKEAYQRHLVDKRKGEIDYQVLVSSGIPSTDDSHKYNCVKRNNEFFVPSIDSRIVAIWDGNNFIKQVNCSENVVFVVTKETNFYAEAGGQVADVGFMTSENEEGKFEVTDVQFTNGYVVHKGRLISGKLRENDAVTLTVDSNYRSGCMTHHTAAHLLNSTLRQILGASAEQRSSKVASDYLRYDFTTETALPSEKLSEVEKRIQKTIADCLPVNRLVIPFTEAKQLPGFTTVPNECYPPIVSVIAIGREKDEEKNFVSLEACCGTHLKNTYDIRDFLILSQKSQGQSIRSIRAVCGPQAIKLRDTATSIEEEIDGILSALNSQESLTEDLNSYYKRLLVNKCILQENFSLLLRQRIEQKCEELKLKLDQTTKKFVVAELSEKIPLFKNEVFVVYLFEISSNDQVVFNEAVKYYNEKPCFWFVKSDDKLQGRCSVSRKLETDVFSAEIWARNLVKNWNAKKKATSKFGVNVEIQLKPDVNINRILESVKKYGDEILANNIKSKSI